MRSIAAILLFILSAISLQLHAQSSNEKRLALIIGNAEYQNANKLLNPVNDARSMKKALTGLGFEVMQYENLTQREMKQVIDEFGRKLEAYDVGLFYFAGHGIQANGNNYLIPVETNLTNEQQIEYDCVRADRVLGLMEYAKSKVNIVILDACRNNPFKRSWSRSAQGEGLAFMNAPSGSLIAYATAPGKTASDGSGSNGLYTEALLKNLFTPDLTILQVFQNVRKSVVDQSARQQIPWESTSLIGDFYFNKTQAGANEQEPKKKLVAKETSDVTTTSTSSINSRAIWKSDEKTWHLLDNKVQIASRTKYSYADDDLLAYDPETGTSYLLPGYTHLTDNVFRPAEILSERDQYFWRSKDLSFYVYDKGTSISTEIVHSKSDDDLLVYHPLTNATLLLERYYQLQDNKLRPARIISQSDNIFWKSKDNKYLFFIKGEQVASTTSSAAVNNDLLVYHEKNGSSYILKNFYNLQDDQLRSAMLISDHKDVFWSAFNNKFHLYVKGKDVSSQVTNKWSGSDLEVNYGNNTYLLKDFASRQDRQLREAIIMESAGKVEWKAENNLFYVKDNNKEIQLQTVYAMAGNDLLVYHPEKQKTYLLENYSHLQDNQWRNARLLSSSSESVFWMSEDNVYWLYVQGKQVAQETTSIAEGRNLLITHTTTGSKYRLKNFYDLQDKQIRPAEVISFNASPITKTDNTKSTDNYGPYTRKGNVTWRSKDNLYWLYVNGEQIAKRTRSVFIDSDLFVYDPTDNLSYLLESYKERQDDQVRSATIYDTSDQTWWRANDGGYYIYVKGELITTATNVQSYWADSDLIVYHKPSGITYRLEDYNTNKDNQLRPAFKVVD
ncbi:caspase family protein [Fulvivirga ulvae]|uniref:caspase family protein n=1 Tax=Fulvivirga ulvae TaxID=2904245 RepID=UPI001F43493D|nr:caspase domain-containing protein [Fulvivirga ulvae]UII30106.1 caspase family protein [Fulvivirga ulvae]